MLTADELIEELESKRRYFEGVYYDTIRREIDEEKIGAANEMLDECIYTVKEFLKKMGVVTHDDGTLEDW